VITFTNSASIIISTCRDSIFNVEDVFVSVLDVIDEIVVVHQLLDNVDSKLYVEHRNYLVSKYSQLKIFVDPGKGLSRSRNIGLLNVNSELIFISDDDNKFVKEGVISVRKHMDLHATDIVLGRVVTPDGIPFKDYDKLDVNVKVRSSGSVSSIEMCLRREFITKYSLFFNEKFGLGTALPSCEEFIFLSQSIKFKAIIKRIDDYVNIHPIESSGKNLSDINIIKAKGAAFKLVFGFKGLLVCIYFSIRKSTSLSNFLLISRNILKGYLSELS
jgi:hypothetical protein